MPEARKELGREVEWCTDMYAAATGANAVILITEWNEFRLPDWPRIKTLLNEPVVFDGRNIYDLDFLQKNGFSSYGIGISPRSVMSAIKQY
jgi:UDPglucose 6-dehydrogenase